MATSLKNNLRQIRRQNRLTQRELAEKVNVSRQTIINIEKNIYIPSTYLSLKIAKILNSTVESIFYI